jgi:putative transposase
MSIRKIPFINNEIYHIYNRGVDKRTIFEDNTDYERFIESIIEMNTQDSFGGLYTKSYLEKNGLKQNIDKKIVDIIAYCLNPNHFHLILKQIEDGGISKFMQRLGTGYTMHFNIQNKRSGSLFQGKFKSAHINSNEYLLYLSAYVNLNDKIHNIKEEDNLVFSSLKEYTGDINGICEKSIILDQFKNKKEYNNLLNKTLPELMRQKEQKRELDEL